MRRHAAAAGGGEEGGKALLAHAHAPAPASPADAQPSDAAMPPDPATLEPVQPSAERFLQLGMYAFASFMCALDWTILAPVYQLGEERFHVGLQRINSLSNAWNIYQAPGSLLALWAMQHVGLRLSLLWGYASQLLCALLASAAARSRGAPSSAFALLYLSQVVGALGQPLVLNNVTRLAADWFPGWERDAAVATSMLCSASGAVFISIYAPMAVGTPAQMPRLFDWQVPAWGALVGLALMFTQDEPALPPSAAAAVQRAARRAAARIAAVGVPPGAEVAGATAPESLAVVLTHAASLLRHENFMMLNASSALITGMVVSMATCVGQLLRPCGVSDDAVGASLASLSALSAVGVLVYLYLLKTAVASPAEPGVPTRLPYVAHQIGWSAASVAGVALVLLLAHPTTPPRVTVAVWGLLGLLSGTLLNGALTMEHAAEITFPLPANVSVAVLQVTGSCVSFLQVLSFTALLQGARAAACESPARSSFAAFAATLAAGGLLCVTKLRPEYRRAEVEAGVVIGHLVEAQMAPLAPASRHSLDLEDATLEALQPGAFGSTSYGATA